MLDEGDSRVENAEMDSVQSIWTLTFPEKGISRLYASRSMKSGQLRVTNSQLILPRTDSLEAICFPLLSSHHSLL